MIDSRTLVRDSVSVGLEADLRKAGAVVIGGEHPGLGIARSLGRRGIPVYIIDDQRTVSSFSRYATRVITVRSLRDEARTVNTVLDVGRRFGLRNWVLFPTRDETVAAISRNRDQLQDFYRVTTPAWDTIKWAWNKRNTYELANQLGIPCPQTFCPRNAEDLVELYPRLPLAIKPAVKENFFYATGAKAWRAETPDQLQLLYAKAARQIDPAHILVQEIIPGGGQQQLSYCAFFRNGEAHSSLVARRMRQHPHEFGRAATYVETVDAPLIEDLSQRFLQAIDFYGLVEVEFKKDPRDGEYKLLDVNARTWGFHALGSVAGVDFPYLLYADQLGQPAPRCRGLSGVGWLRVLTDVPVVLSEMLHGRLNWRSYFESLRNTRIESVFSKEDPLPFFAEFALLPYLITKKHVL
jgi:D-aspartate ligase